MTKSRKTQAKKGTLVVLIVFALVAVIGGTYARYTASSSSNAQLQVAKWAVAFKTNSAPISESNKLTFTVNSNNYVAANRIAPSNSATANAVIDLTGTEVGVDMVVTADTASIATTLGIDASRITTSLTVNGETKTPGSTPTTLTYAQVDGLTNGQVPVVVTVTWAEDNSTANNTADTAAGAEFATIDVPVTLTVTQHV